MKHVLLLASTAAMAGCVVFAGTFSVPGGMAADRPAIGYGQTVNGTLDAGDPMADDQSYYDAWTFTGRAGETVRITLESDDFDAFLVLGRLRGGRWTELENNDGGLEGTDAEIVYTLPEDGEYVIRANTLSPGETGSYSLTLRRR